MNHANAVPACHQKSLFCCKPSQMGQENQMAQETSLCKERAAEEHGRPFLNERSTVRAASASSSRELESVKLWEVMDWIETRGKPTIFPEILLENN